MPCLREAGRREGNEEQWHPTSKADTSSTGACARRRHPHSCLVWTTPTEPLRSGRTKPHQRHPSGRGGGALAANPQRVAALRAASPALRSAPLRRPLFFLFLQPPCFQWVARPPASRLARPAEIFRGIRLQLPRPRRSLNAGRRRVQRGSANMRRRGIWVSRDQLSRAPARRASGEPQPPQREPP
ncbi:uncharacterized protein Tco025E_08636 [Trypanosoma conorhini]|uniref:Uncharacterized protein n=1 Tax=Trypanosoma conorhini TaxID=83891 RepID=A0A422N740_9TRYP|nr:uncharacterized protein Tco025E_08636 [Trypanosoma conorhini]RNF01261.1 hypothetical protein Tco025E_08636 [Trypanosoma conorhini]